MVNKNGCVLTALLVVVGCGGGSANLEPCDIRQDSCRQNVFLAVSDVRNTGWDPWQSMPPTRVISVDQYVAELNAESASVKRTPALVAWEQSLKMLRFIPPDLSLSAARAQNSSQVVAAYYSSNDKNITVIDRGDATNQSDDTATLAHELVHAAQDRDVGLNWYLNESSSFDDSMARLSVAEGEAVLYSNLVMFPSLGFGPEQADWDKYHNGWIAKERGVMTTSTSPFFDVRLLVYPLGSRRLTSTWTSGGSAATRALWSGSPGPTRDLMNTAGDPLEAPICRLPRAPAGTKVSEAPFEFGALMVYALATRWTDEGTAWVFGVEWLGDKMTVFSSTDGGNVALAWVIRMQKALHAQELADSVTLAADPRVSAHASGQEVQIAAATDPTLLAAVSAPCP